MRALFRFLSGYVCVSFRGYQLERFFSLCKNRGIAIECLRYHGKDCYSGYLSVPDFFKLKPVRAKTGTVIHLKKKCGVPFLLKKAFRNKAFFIGMFLFGILLFCLGGRIWNIHITGNQYYSTPEILSFLEETGIKHGISKNRISCTAICEGLRKQYPKMAWVSAKTEGTRLLLTVCEGKLMDISEEKKEPCDLIAAESGIIVNMITRQGTPLKKTGDFCEKGEVLVKGSLEILNDSQEIVRYEYVHADADVAIKRKIYYYDRFPLKHLKKKFTGRKKTGFFVKIGALYFSAEPKIKENRDRISETRQLRLTESFYLPLYWGKTQCREFRMVTEKYSKEEAEKLAFASLSVYEKKLMEKGVQISENNVKINVNGNECTGSGSLTVIEQATVKQTAVQQEKPEERTAEDDWQYN